MRCSGGRFGMINNVTAGGATTVQHRKETRRVRERAWAAFSVASWAVANWGLLSGLKPTKKKETAESRWRLFGMGRMGMEGGTKGGRKGGRA